ncbi:hypothetical protein ACP6O1_002343 [Cronobacter dublinensis]
MTAFFGQTHKYVNKTTCESPLIMMEKSMLSLRKILILSTLYTVNSTGATLSSTPPPVTLTDSIYIEKQYWDAPGYIGVFCKGAPGESVTLTGLGEASGKTVTCDSGNTDPVVRHIPGKPEVSGGVLQYRLQNNTDSPQTVKIYSGYLGSSYGWPVKKTLTLAARGQPCSIDYEPQVSFTIMRGNALEKRLLMNGKGRGEITVKPSPADDNGGYLRSSAEQKIRYSLRGGQQVWDSSSRLWKGVNSQPWILTFSSHNMDVPAGQYSGTVHVHLTCP